MGANKSVISSNHNYTGSGSPNLLTNNNNAVFNTLEVNNQSKPKANTTSNAGYIISQLKALTCTYTLINENIFTSTPYPITILKNTSKKININIAFSIKSVYLLLSKSNQLNLSYDSSISSIFLSSPKSQASSGLHRPIYSPHNFPRKIKKIITIARTQSSSSTLIRKLKTYCCKNSRPKLRL